MNEKTAVTLQLDLDLLEKYKKHRDEVSPKFPVEETFEHWLEEDMRAALFEVFSSRLQGANGCG